MLAALVLVACGGGGGVGGEQQKAADAADEICLEAQDKVGNNLGDDPAADRDAIREATDKLMAIDEPSQNQNRWELLVQNTNNLWIALDDIHQALLPEVNDRARAERARVTVAELNDKIKRYADQYNAVECAEGYGRTARRGSN